MRKVSRSQSSAVLGDDPCQLNPTGSIDGLAIIVPWIKQYIELIFDDHVKHFMFVAFLVPILVVVVSKVEQLF